MKQEVRGGHVPWATSACGRGPHPTHFPRSSSQQSPSPSPRRAQPHMCRKGIYFQTSLPSFHGSVSQWTKSPAIVTGPVGSPDPASPLSGPREVQAGLELLRPNTHPFPEGASTAEAGEDSHTAHREWAGHVPQDRLLPDSPKPPQQPRDQRPGLGWPGRNAAWILTLCQVRREAFYTQ